MADTMVAKKVFSEFRPRLFALLAPTARRSPRGTRDPNTTFERVTARQIRAALKIVVEKNIRGGLAAKLVDVAERILDRRLARELRYMKHLPHNWSPAEERRLSG